MARQNGRRAAVRRDIRVWRLFWVAAPEQLFSAAWMPDRGATGRPRCVCSGRWPSLPTTLGDGRRREQDYYLEDWMPQIPSASVIASDAEPSTEPLSWDEVRQRFDAERWYWVATTGRGGAGGHMSALSWPFGCTTRSTRPPVPVRARAATCRSAQNAQWRPALRPSTSWSRAPRRGSTTGTCWSRSPRPTTASTAGQ